MSQRALEQARRVLQVVEAGAHSREHTRLMSHLSWVAHHWSTVMVLMVVTEVMAVTHRPMVIVDHNRVDVVVGTVVPQDR